MDFLNAGADDGEVAPVQGIDGGQELLAAQRAGAAEGRPSADFHELRDAADMVVVPVGRHDQMDGPGRIQTDAFQVRQGTRPPIGIQAGVDDHPCAAADVQNDALSVAGPEDRDFEFVVARRLAYPGHASKARAVSSAHASASRRSAAVIAGRSRNTICDTRFLVPVTERS